MLQFFKLSGFFCKVRKMVMTFEAQAILLNIDTVGVIRVEFWNPMKRKKKVTAMIEVPSWG
jgi:hypothetical protein